MRKFLFIGVVLTCLLFVSCGRGNDYIDELLENINDLITTTPSPPPSTPAPIPTPEPTPEPEIYVPMGPVSHLTGLPIYEEYIYRRPIAVVINNLHRALPQSGILSADVIYEVLTEGDVTRILGIFQSCIPEKIGPVRSMRDYLIDLALNHDAIFVHHGQSPNSYRRIPLLRGARLDGMALEGPVFWRDRSYPAWFTLNTGQRPFEHSSFTNFERIQAHVGRVGIRYSWPEDVSTFGFSFYSGDSPDSEGMGEANVIHVPFSQGYPRTFTYDPEQGLYLVENRHGPHLDEEGEQIMVRNVIIQFVNKSLIAGDDAGRRTVQTVGAGRGYLAANGSYQPIRWVRETHTTPTRWYFYDGTPMYLMPGKTWINVFQTTGTVVFE